MLLRKTALKFYLQLTRACDEVSIKFTDVGNPRVLDRYVHFSGPIFVYEIH